MSPPPSHGPSAPATSWRIAAWTAAAAVLLAPLIAMQFTSDVNWTAADFAFAGTLLAAVGLAAELAVRRTRNRAYRAAAAIALATGLMLVWANAAVGILGSEDQPVNLVFHGIVALAIAGALLARFRPAGMARAMLATAVAQALSAALAIAAGATVEAVFIVGFAALWLVSSMLFKRAVRTSGGREGPSPHFV